MHEVDLYRSVVAKVRVAAEALEALMLSDTWDSVPPRQQRHLAEAASSMRADLERLELALRSSRSGSDN